MGRKFQKTDYWIFGRLFRMFEIKRIFDQIFRLIDLKRIFGRLFIFYFFLNLNRFYRLSEYSVFMPNIRLIIYFIYIFNTHKSITSHPIAFNLLNWYCYKRPGSKNWDPGPVGSSRIPIFTNLLAKIDVSLKF